MIWIRENALALYGAITGTLALVMSYIGHKHSVRRDRIKLTVEFEPHPDQAGNLNRLRASPNTETPWNDHVPHLVEYFVVTVRNLGSVAAPLTDVGIRSKNGVKHPALVSAPSDSCLRRIPDSSIEPLEPNSFGHFSVFLRAKSLSSPRSQLTRSTRLARSGDPALNPLVYSSFEDARG